MTDKMHMMMRRVLIKDSGSHRQYVVGGYSGTEGSLAVLFDPYTHTLVQSVPWDRLEPLPEPKSARPKNYLNLDGVSATADEALEWMAFVMLQAGSLFQNVPGHHGDPSEDPTRGELLRILTARGESPSGPIVTAAMAYYDAAVEWYREDEESDK